MSPTAARGAFAIGADAKGKLRFRKPDVEGDHLIVLVSEKVSQAYLAHLQEAGVSYLFCGEQHVDLGVALDKLRRVLGIRGRLMLEAAAPSTAPCCAKDWWTR